MPKRCYNWSGTRGKNRKKRIAKEPQYWEVENVLDVRPSAKQEDSFECRIKWKDWNGEDTWEPRENLTGEALQIADRLVAQYKLKSKTCDEMEHRVTPSPPPRNVTASDDSDSQLSLLSNVSEQKSAAKKATKRPPRPIFDFEDNEVAEDRSSLQTFSVDNDGDGDRKMAAVEIEASQELSKAALAQMNYDQLTPYEKAKQHLNNLPNVWPDEVAKALEIVGPPYGLQEVTRVIREIREEETWKEPGLFQPHKGMEVRAFMNGEYHTGLVTSEEEDVEYKGKVIKAWHVVFEDEDEADFSWDELLRCRTWKQRSVAPCRGRAFQCLELFSGKQ